MEWWIDIPHKVLELRLVTDVQGAMVLLFSDSPDEENGFPPGLYAIRSTDNGDTWSDKLRVDPELT
ncbi:MAG: hypothetical protein R2748_04645 [Bryobacterales bacterium]